MTVKPIRDGFHTVTPYLFAEGVSRVIDFISAAFDGEILFRHESPDGTDMHAEMRVGNSMVMLGESSDEFPPMPSSIYLYVTDCDTQFQSALDAGGISVFDVRDLPSGERYSGVEDPCGNLWWIATHKADPTPEEEEKGWKEFKR